MKTSGFELLKEQSLAQVASAFDEFLEHKIGDTEIERLMFAALFCRIEHGYSEFDDLIVAADSNHANEMRNGREYLNDLIVQRQVQIGNYRVDFVVSAWTWGSVASTDEPTVVGEPRWRKLVIECDGHDFHERTKEQAARDRSRDRALNAAGFDVFRFTGSELWRDPWGCADQVHEWAARGI